MALEEELRRIREENKRESTRARQRTLQEEREARTRELLHLELRQKQLNDRAHIVEEYNARIRQCLTIIGRETWGEDCFGEERFVVISPDGYNSTTWAAIREQRGRIHNYRVTLIVKEDDITKADVPAVNGLIEAIHFSVAGKEERIAGLSHTELENTIAEVYKLGPDEGNIDSYTAAQLARTPYKPNESDAVHYFMILFSIGSICSGIWLLQKYIALGVVIIAAGIGSLLLTSFGCRFRRFSIRIKLLIMGGLLSGILSTAALAAVAAMVVLGFIFFVLIMFLVLWLMGQGLESEMDSSKRVDEISRGVSRGIEKSRSFWTR